MSWKLAELKWRQELGLYESRWERESGPLPLERKHAVEVFERRKMVSPGRRTSTSVMCRPNVSPGRRHSTRLGTAAPPTSSSVTLPALHPSRDLVASHEYTTIRCRSPRSLETILDASAAQYNPSTETERLPLCPVGPRSQSCSPLPHQRASCLPFSPSPICIPSLQTKQAENSEQFSSWLPALENHTPQIATACEELTRLLDHIDPASQADTLKYEASVLPTLDTVRCESGSHLPEAIFLPFASLSQSEEAIRSGDRLSVKGTSFRLLPNDQQIENCQISTVTDTSETFWPTTLSRHNSSSTLLPNTNMSRGITESDENGTPGSNEDSETQPQSNTQGPVQPIRRTTPIYQNYGQAYTSITGGITGARFDSQPGTDSLNNVYTRAMNDETATSTGSFGPQDDATVGIGGPVQFPFRRSASPENNDHMYTQDVGDNPAGMRIEPTDVALQAILRTVPRSSVTYATSLPREPSSLVFQQTDRLVRNRSTSVPMRSPTPYPDRRNDDDSLDSSVGAILDQYGNEDSTIDRISSISVTTAGGLRVHPRQVRTLTTAGPPPAWPLPVEPSTLPRDLSDEMAQSSSPPTYGATTELLDRRHRPASALREQILRLPQRALARNSSLYSSELDEIIARRGNSSTPFDQIGDPGPAVNSSPRSSSPAPEVVPRPRIRESGMAIHFDQRRTQDNANPPSSSGIGIALTSMDDPVVRYEANDNVAGFLRAGVDVDDDAAWETTQGSNTQRNSAVPEVDYAAFSSTESLGRQATSTWDPLAANLRGLAEAEREFAQIQLVQAQETSLLGVLQNEAPEHSMHIISLNGVVHAGPSTSVASPEQTFTTTTTSPFQNNNHYLQSLPGTSLLRRTPRTNIPLSDTIVNMSSETGADNERAARIAAVEQEIRRYEPRSSEEGPRRYFPEARLTTDRRVLDAENDETFVHRQQLLARSLLAASIVTYPFGGFLLINSMASNGPVARSAILSLSLSGGGPPINNVHPVDMALAERVEMMVLFCVAAGLVGIVAVLVAFLRGALA